MKNLGALMKQAQQMQSKMAEMQEKLAGLEVGGRSGGGLVEVLATGKGDVKRVKIDPSLLVPAEVEVLEDLIVAALADAKAKVEAAAAEQMREVTGGLSLPPGMKLPF
ncbi:MAG: YbaB/EbfC family nucleoid-associated protein [Azospirillum sp.]|jgi:DNA-binding YbaB/EbfC family protein|nr:YbaB/EbfC family nucleoid-associated protein [Azospirillum sp.]MCZ8125083.1 YbaB/EbfC family nucleoid-associated protein [Magnetospirillum sp.]